MIGSRYGHVRLGKWSLWDSKGDFQVCQAFGVEDGLDILYMSCVVHEARYMSCLRLFASFGHLEAWKMRSEWGFQDEYVSWWKFEGKADVSMSYRCYVMCKTRFQGSFIAGSRFGHLRLQKVWKWGIEGAFWGLVSFWLKGDLEHVQ